jgi:hypothetical protein
MRAILLALIVPALLLAASAKAAPTCRDKNLQTVRCGTPGAMPVGWEPSPQQLWERQLSQPAGPSTAEVLKVLGGIGLLFALIALLPEFDGSRAGGGWDRQEGDQQGDDEERD